MIRVDFLPPKLRKLTWVHLYLLPVVMNASMMLVDTSLSASALPFILRHPLDLRGTSITKLILAADENALKFLLIMCALIPLPGETST